MDRSRPTPALRRVQRHDPEHQHLLTADVQPMHRRPDVPPRSSPPHPNALTPTPVPGRQQPIEMRVPLDLRIQRVQKQLLIPAVDREQSTSNDLRRVLSHAPDATASRSSRSSPRHGPRRDHRSAVLRQRQVEPVSAPGALRWPATARAAGYRPCGTCLHIARSASGPRQASLTRRPGIGEGGPDDWRS